MPNVTEDAAQVGQMLINALQNTLGMSPEAAVAQAQAETGVSDDTVQHADMGQAGRPHRAGADRDPDRPADRPLQPAR